MFAISGNNAMAAELINRTVAFIRACPIHYSPKDMPSSSQTNCIGVVVLLVVIETSPPSMLVVVVFVHYAVAVVPVINDRRRIVVVVDLLVDGNRGVVHEVLDVVLEQLLECLVVYLCDPVGARAPS